MNIRPISVYNYSTNRQTKLLNANYRPTNSIRPVFKGDRGATIGIAAGFLAGAGLTALIIATGGLASIVAAVGAGTTAVGGGAACTHLGGIAGGLIEDHLDKKDNKK